MRTLLLAAALSMSALAGCASKSDGDSAGTKAEANFPNMTVDEVDKAVAAKEVQAVDCNHDKLRQKLGVVPGAILISDAESYPASELPADKGAKLVFYCADPG
jgi:hypothetical protein